MLRVGLGFWTILRICDFFGYFVATFCRSANGKGSWGGLIRRVGIGRISFGGAWKCERPRFRFCLRAVCRSFWSRSSRLVCLCPVERSTAILLGNPHSILGLSSSPYSSSWWTSWAISSFSPCPPPSPPPDPSPSSSSPPSNSPSSTPTARTSYHSPSQTAPYPS